MKFKRRLKKEKTKRELRGHVDTLRMAADDAKRFNEIAGRVSEIKRAGVIDDESTRELARLSEEIKAIRAKYSKKA